MTPPSKLRPSAVLLALALHATTYKASLAFVVPSAITTRPISLERALSATADESDVGRRSVLLGLPSLIGGALVAVTQSAAPAGALVKGNAPPPKSGSSAAPGGEKKCRNVEECQEQAERLEAQRLEEARANAVPAEVAPRGSRYRNVEVGKDDGREAKLGDTVDLRYKVLKLGKRSYDGLSGEGTVVFSRGYGLEDDEKVPGDKSFVCTLGDSQLIAALSDAVPGMKPGGIRRISILPQMGWRKPGKECDGGPGGSGAGGELKTDYVVVPTATMVNEEACFDKTRQPFPTAYAEQRRMAQRFDQSLIVEVELVGFK